mgnify:CR=1 FL=1
MFGFELFADVVDDDFKFDVVFPYFAVLQRVDRLEGESLSVDSILAKD